MNAPKRILLFVTGLSPQVVTETLYALATDAESPWIPDEIHVITTSEGADQVRLSLLSEEPAWFARLIEDYDLPAIRFDESHIHVLECADGSPMEDVRTPQDNEQAADQITEWVRQFTREDDSELHASIAGGRKTLGYYLGYALSLFGRPQDRLSHVLVSEPFESSRSFFYPMPTTDVMETRSQSLTDPRVELAEIPFVRLRDELPRQMLIQQGRASFSSVVAAAQKASQPPRLEIDLAARRVVASGETISLTPASLAFLTMFARAENGELPRLRHDSPDLGARYLAEYARIVGLHSGDFEKVETALNSEDLKDWFEQRKSKMNRELEGNLGRSLSRRYRLHGRGHRPNTTFGLDLEPDVIVLRHDGKLAVDTEAGRILQDGAIDQDRSPA